MLQFLEIMRIEKEFHVYLSSIFTQVYSSMVDPLSLDPPYISESQIGGT